MPITQWDRGRITTVVTAGIWLLGGVVSLGASAIPGQETVPAPHLVQSLPELLESYQQTPSPADGSLADNETRVSIDLPQLIALVIEGNRDLRNATLDRIVQQQALTEAESRFDWDITPRFSVNLTEQLNLDAGADANGDRTTLDRSLEVEGRLLTPLGTTLQVGIDPLDEDQTVEFTISQPLLRGAGRAVNEAPIRQARLSEQRNQLTLYQQTLELVTNAITSYTALIQQQEAVKIQQQALVRRQEQNEIIEALVNAGRLPRIDLIEAEGNIANAERDLQDARNQLAQANTNLLNLIGSEQSIQFVATVEVIDQLLAAALTQIPTLDLDDLTATAFENRPEYHSAQLAIEEAQLGVLLAADAQRWQLDLTGSNNLGITSTAGIGLILTRQFEDESLETARQSSQVSLEQSQNNFAQVTTNIHNQVASSLEDVRSNQRRLEAAQRATESDELQLQADRERFRLGRSGITLFTLIQREEALVNAQNAQLSAAIDLLNSIAQLEQAVGITLTRWQDQVDFNPVFEVPTLDTGES